MKVEIASSELLRIINRHKAKCLGDLEAIACPQGYRDIVRNHLDYLRNDLISASKTTGAE